MNFNISKATDLRCEIGNGGLLSSMKQLIFASGL